LKLEKRPVNQLFRDRFTSHLFLANHNKLTLSIEDEMSVSEYYKENNYNVNININFPDNNSKDDILAFNSLDCLYIKVDIIRLDQVIDNFLVNACNHTKAGGIVKLKFSFREKDQNGKE